MRVRSVVRTLSELCVTVGMLTVLFVVYLLYWTGVRADRAMDSEIGRLQEQWQEQRQQQHQEGREGQVGEQGRERPERRREQRSAGPVARAGRPASPQRPYRAGAPFAVMYIPRLGAGWAKPVLQGTGTELLKKGLGHYERTARLGEVGNFAVAGHRRTHGDPFRDLPSLRPGDAVLLTDGTTWFTYRVDARPYRTVPDDTGVIDPVPAGSGYRGPGRYLTLTTCEPEWGHSHRLIVWGHLDATRPVDEGRPNALPG